MSGLDLGQLLSPVAVEEFLRDSWGKNFLYVPGTPSKFDDLFSWDALNSVLAQHRLEPPRLRLEQAGGNQRDLTFLDYRLARRGINVPRINLAELYRHLQAGATLVLDAVDEVDPRITHTCEELTAIFTTQIQVNAYASWGSSPGFGLHWDDHDVLVVQVAGSKHWSVHSITRRFPLYRDSVTDLDKPSDSPIWESEIHAGDLLYVPRGQWHNVTGLNKPSLHLTIGINNPTGVDLLTWLADEMREVEIFRCDLPQFGSEDERRAHLQRLRAALDQEWADGALIDRYFAARSERLRPRAHLSLPLAAGSSSEPLPPDLIVRFVGSAKGSLSESSDSKHVTLKAIGKEWTFVAALRPFLETLLSRPAVTVSELVAVSSLGHERVSALVIRLIREGLISFP